LSELTPAGLEEILAAHGGSIAPQLAAISDRLRGLVRIRYGLIEEPIDDNTAAILRELDDNGVFDLDSTGISKYFEDEFAALQARLDSLDKLLTGAHN
jgi:hypothetical protein